MSNERLTDPNDSIIASVFKISGGNPGSMKVCSELLKHSNEIDPLEGMPEQWSGFSNILTLDSLNIWDERIYVLYDNVCGSDLVKMISLLRARQMGNLAGITKDTLDLAIKDKSAFNINFDAVAIEVTSVLPKFNQQPPITGK